MVRHAARYPANSLSKRSRPPRKRGPPPTADSEAGQRRAPGAPATHCEDKAIVVLRVRGGLVGALPTMAAPLSVWAVGAFFSATGRRTLEDAPIDHSAPRLWSTWGAAPYPGQIGPVNFLDDSSTVHTPTLWQMSVQFVRR